MRPTHIIKGDLHYLKSTDCRDWWRLQSVCWGHLVLQSDGRFAFSWPRNYSPLLWFAPSTVSAVSINCFHFFLDASYFPLFCPFSDTSQLNAAGTGFQHPLLGTSSLFLHTGSPVLLVFSAFLGHFGHCQPLIHFQGWGCSWGKNVAAKW